MNLCEKFFCYQKGYLLVLDCILKKLIIEASPKVHALCVNPGEQDPDVE